MPEMMTSPKIDWPASLAVIGIAMPRPSQQAVAEALLAGRRVVLRAPAGGGKSMAAWLPWLMSRTAQHDFPATLLHVLPGGTFYGDLLTRLSLLAPTARVGVHTESDACDPFFLSDATITSIEQLLSVALHRPLGLHPSLANLNAGVLLGAYLVFDEFPALQHGEALRLWAGLLRTYFPDASALFAGATMPRPVMQWLAQMLGAEVMEIEDASGGRRIWQRQDALTPEGILRRHAERTIVVCNTVRGAQTLYRALRRVADSPAAPELFLLHQYQLPRDRAPIEAQVRERFTANGQHAILVTTTGIEVGASISADLVITDPAAPDALLRRAGRCARDTGESGRVIIARVSTPGASAASPVGEHLLHALCDDGEKSFNDEMAAYDAAWEAITDGERRAALGVWPDAAALDAETRAMMESFPNFPRRDATRVGVCLHCVPETVSDPFELERFSVPMATLERGWRQWQASGSPGEWFALTPHWPAETQRTPSWHPVAKQDDFRADTRLVVLNADAVSYDPVLGLEMAPGTPYQSARIPEQHTAWYPFDQHAKSYEEHAARVADALDRAVPGYRYVLRHLATRWHMPMMDLERWMRLAVLWHDAGKLTADWQRAAFRWQTEHCRRPVTAHVLGRIDFQIARDGAFPCPEHAAAGAQVLVRAFAFLLGRHVEVHQGILAALCHHHGFVAVGGEDLTPHPEGWATLLELAQPVLDTWQLRRLDRAGWTLAPRGMREILAAPPTDVGAWQAYSLLVRVIRLADRDIALAEFDG